MPWKECKPMDERLRFIARLLEAAGFHGQATGGQHRARRAGSQWPR